MSRIETIGNATLYLGDCRDILPTLPKVDLVLTDPPYGMNWNTDSTRFTGGNMTRGEGRNDWGEIAEDKNPFDPEFLLEYPRVIMFGSNHYAARLPVGTTLVWIKKPDHAFNSFLSDAEVGWMKGGHGVYCYRKLFPPPSRMVENGGVVAHPTQKPIGLMEWCISLAKSPSTVADPFMGSGTTGVACANLGKTFYGIEREVKYFDIACRRIEDAYRQQRLFA